MRLFVSVLLAAMLAVPALALADRGSDDRATKSVQHKVAKRKQQKQLRHKAHAAARAKSIATARAAGATVTPTGKLEVKGVLTSLTPLTVGAVSCAVPASLSLRGFAVGDFVELECKLVAGAWTLHELELEDDHAASDHGTSDDDDHDDDDRSGHHDDDDHDDDHDDD